MSDEFVTLWCPMCGGVSHPSTGCAYSPTFVVCWRCTLDFAKWLQAWTNKRGRHGLNFFDHVGMAIPAGKHQCGQNPQ